MPQKISPYDWYASILSGKSALFSDLDSKISEDELWQTGLDNGVLALTNHMPGNSGTLSALPQNFRERLQKHTLNAAASELGLEHELKIVFSKLNSAKLSFLLMKGTPLAYSDYPQPYLRSRCDTDILFSSNKEAESAWRILKDFGYSRPNAVSGEFVSHEFSCSKTGKQGISNTLDMHWKLNNAQRFARALNFKELTASAIPIPELGGKVLSLGPIHALLLACMHRIAHKTEKMENRLIWLYDIKLLTEKFSREQWQEFIALAATKELSGICLDGIQQTMQTFNSSLPEDPINTLREKASHEKYSTEMGESRLSMEISNLRALPGWKERFGLIKERLFPDTSYMMVKYNTQKKALLPYLYLKRAIGGVFKVFR